MRSNGVSSFPDPISGHGFQFDVTAAEVSSPAFKGAQQACRSYLPAGPTQQAGAVTAGELRYAACMRRHGLRRYPDPTANSAGPEYMQQLTRARINRRSPAFHRAARACRSA